MYLNKTATIVK